MEDRVLHAVIEGRKRMNAFATKEGCFIGQAQE